MSYSPETRVRRVAVLARAAAAVASTLVLLGACDELESPSAAEQAELAMFELPAGELPASPTNRVADDEAAATLGRKLFFDRGLSADGTVACVDCHDPKLGLADARRVSEGIGGQKGARHALPVSSAALLPYLMWDGRADTVWRQPLLALENEREMAFTRIEVARYVAEHHAEDYEAVFGELPDLSTAPERGKPGDAAWDALDEGTRDAVQRVFVDVGKAIEAYERRIVCSDTRFDRWTRGEVELTAEELDGAAQFVRSGCTNCHRGAAFSDGGFHNLGLSSADSDPIDEGRDAVIAALLDDPLNGAGPYSDDPAFGAAKLAKASDETRTLGAFRTASLRGVAQRARFGHRGVQTDLAEFIEDTYRGRGRGGRGDDDDRDGRGGDDDDDIVGALDPLLDGVDADGDAPERIATFLETLSCPDLPADLVTP